MPQTGNGQTVVSRKDARAGMTGQGVRYVLVYGTLGVVTLFAVLFLYFFA